MISARFEYVALFIGAAVYFHGRVELGELVVFLGAAVAIFEIAMFRVQDKIKGWPSDSDNAQRVMDLISTNDVLDQIMALEFGSAPSVLIDKLELIERPGMQGGRFNDPALRASFRYLQEKAGEVLQVVREEMFSPDVRFSSYDGLMLPLEWKNAPHDSPPHIRYRTAQKRLLAESRKLVVAIDAFANCFQGASRRW